VTELESLALRCLLPGFEGSTAPRWVLRRAAEGLGGVVLFARNIDTRVQLAALTAELHRARPALVVAIDEEGGEVTRLEARTGSSYPGNLALGVAGDESLTREVAGAIGSELAASGIDLNLAPVADVNSNPRNPIIGVRSFGSDARTVASHTAAWIDGMQGAGVAACAKHFPGHGDTSIDSHLELPVVNEDPHLRALAPFAAAIAHGVQAVMSAHIVVPDIDREPATASRRVMQGILRDELGFEGLAITDGLEMRGFSGPAGIGEDAVRAIAAGCDALCIGGGLADEAVVDEIVGALSAAVDRGRLAEPRLREAAARVDALAAWRSRQGASAQRDPEAGLQAARRAVRAEGDVLVGPATAVLRFPSAPSIAAGEVPWGVANALSARGVHITASDVDLAAHDLAVPERGSVVLVVRDLHRDPEQGAHIGALLRKRPDAVVVEMGLPMCRPSEARNYVATHGSARVCAQAAAEVMRP
jgi:beta-N-acetylhexosaminidase